MRTHFIFSVALCVMFIALIGSNALIAQESQAEEEVAEESLQEDADEAEEPAPERAPGSMGPAPARPELRHVFEQFGGRQGLDQLMDVFMTELVADSRTKPFFEQVDQATVKRQLAEQFCVILGGDCVYTGRDMKTAHAELNIKREHMNALVEILQKSMQKQKIPFRAQNKLLGILAPMHRDIEKKATKSVASPND